MKIALAQINPIVGDIAANRDMICRAIADARDTQRADLVLFPELALCGYPPEDLLFHAGLRAQIEAALPALREATRGIAAIIGYPEYAGDAIYNAAVLFDDGRQTANYRKQILPNYGVFDEQRYFTRGDASVVAEVASVRVGLAICEDLWTEGPCGRLAAAGADVIASIHGSPYNIAKHAQRAARLTERYDEAGVPIVYCNLVGGQDELVFDGGSLAFDGGAVVARAPSFEAGTWCVEVVFDDDGRATVRGGPQAALPDDVAAIYAALVTGVRDYVGKNGFPGIVLGLSGGIDSALTLAVAVDALGAGAVQTIMMPYRYTADISVEDAAAQAGLLGVDYRVVPIEPMVVAANDLLAPLFDGRPPDATEENIQSRCRGLLLMAVSNKTGRMVLTTGNKSEMAVGYATLYGDMNGGYAPIKDCNKTLVYRLARYRNSLSAAIPVRVIERAPSAELAPGQTDADSLPPYEVLDPILDALMLDNLSAEEIIARGFDRDIVVRVLSLVRRNEYKRRQAAPGVRITPRAFGRDWRYPVTSGYSLKS